MKVSEKMEVSIIIINYNTWHLLGPCIESIHEHCGGVDYEIIVVDNASSDGSLEKIRGRFPEVRLIANSENAGFARANNQGLEIAGGRRVFLLNADTLLIGPGLKSALDYMDREGVSILGPRLVNADGSLQVSFQKVNTIGKQLRNIAVTAFSLHRLALRRKAPEAKLQEVGFIMGAAMLIDGGFVREEGLFDEQFFFMSEERDLCLRSLAAGRKIVYYPEWVILHYGHSGMKTTPFHLLNWIKSTLKLVRKHGVPSQLWQVRLLFLVMLVKGMAVNWLKALFLRDKGKMEYVRVNCRVLLWYLGLMREERVYAKKAG